MTRWISIQLLVAGMATLAHAGPTYSGNLTSSDGGLVGNGGWVANPAKPVTFDWVVSENPDASWHYHYVFDSTGSQGTLGHLVLETSLTLTADDIFNATPEFENDGPKWQTQQTHGNGNHPIPEPVFGIKFEQVSGTLVVIDFDSDHVPIWGDFYAKGGSVSGNLWNAGFTPLDVDPFEPADNGSLGCHVLVPDTMTFEAQSIISPVVPVPGALVLGMIGTSFIVRLRKRLPS
jgi:hypothetical protein